MRSFLVHGHRGARRRPGLAENTLPAFVYAIEQGADAIELDLAVSSDGVVVVSHDPTLPDGAAIHGLRAADLPLPTLDQVLALAGRGRFDFNLEIKSFPGHPEFSPPPDEFARLVLERVCAHRLEERTIVQSFDWRTLAAMRAIAPEIRRSALTEDDPRAFAEIAAAAAGTPMVSPMVPLVTPQKVAAAHAAGLGVMVWTANTSEEWLALADAGVDAMITDDPAGLIAWRTLRVPPNH